MIDFTKEITMEFDFYLDAWKYCVDKHIDLKFIKKISFRQWAIKYN